MKNNKAGKTIAQNAKLTMNSLKVRNTVQNKIL